MTKQFPEIKTVLLDADGVVQKSGGHFVSNLEALCPDPSQSRLFLEDVFLAERPCLTGKADFPAQLEQVLGKWGIDILTSDALDLWNQIQPVAEILDAVSTLREQGIRVCLATNQQAHRAGIMADGLSYATQFDDLFFSYQLGVAKPAPEYFKKILNQLGTNGENTLFVDDHTQNVAAAEEVGIVGEVFHIDSGFGEFTAILERYGLSTL